MVDITEARDRLTGFTIAAVVIAFISITFMVLGLIGHHKDPNKVIVVKSTEFWKVFSFVIILAGGAIFVAIANWFLF